MKGDDLGNNKMSAALNKQVNAELYSAYLYLGMANYCAAQNLLGFQNWLNLQAKEEMNHALKFMKFIGERCWPVTLMKIDAPEINFTSPLALFQAVFDHEQKITASINNLVALAVDVKDYPSSSFLQWFIDEQVEEEANADHIVQKLRFIGNDKVGLLMLDAELAKRT